MCRLKINYLKILLIFIAAKYGHLEIVKLLVHHNADVNAKSNDAWTALDNG